MGAWRRFGRLSQVERGLFLRAILLLPVAVCALRFTGLRNAKRLVQRRPKVVAGPARGNMTELRLVNAARRMTEAASRHGVVRGNCLSKSIVLWHLLRREGLGATVHFGGRKEGSLFEAHAWVELDGRTINDSEGVRERFVPFEGQASSALANGK
jgi:hypothetical protein